MYYTLLLLLLYFRVYFLFILLNFIFFVSLKLKHGLKWSSGKCLLLVFRRTSCRMHRVWFAFFCVFLILVSHLIRVKIYLKNFMKVFLLFFGDFFLSCVLLRTEWIFLIFRNFKKRKKKIFFWEPEKKNKAKWSECKKNADKQKVDKNEKILEIVKWKFSKKSEELRKHCLFIIYLFEMLSVTRAGNAQKNIKEERNFTLHNTIVNCIIFFEEKKKFFMYFLSLFFSCAVVYVFIFIYTHLSFIFYFSVEYS